MQCPDCDAINPDGARFCASCGHRLSVIACGACGATLTPGARFCTSCGEPVADAVSPAPGAEPAPPAERRRVSVLFVDLVNFTALAESLDPEEVRSIQARYFEVARSIVATYAGTIEKFIGDAVMAVWGAPTAHEDDAERAVRAALGIVYAVDRIGGAAAGTRLSARAAVATGEAAVSVGSIGQGIVAGDLVNIAARLQGRAPAGGVLVDRATRDAIGHAIDARRVGSLALKGRSGRQEAYRVTSVEADEPSRRSAAHSGRLVGRERELRELTELLGDVMRDRRCRLVSITGIAGIGKSRLAWELDRWVDAHPEEIAWHDGRALAYGEGVAYAAVAQMVRRRARIADRAPPELARRQLASMLEEFVRDEAERRWLEPRLATLLGLEEVTAFERDELFAAWRRLFERVADRTPVVMVFEDLHWADAGLLDFIEHVAAWSRSAPIFILTLARPELLDRRPGWGSGAASFTAITLERLADREMGELLAEHASSVPSATLDRILQRAGGVPLYAVEVARMLAEGAAGPRRDGEVPESLHGLVAARIDSLPPAERRLVMAAAVLGHRFRPEALVQVAGSEAGATRDRVANLRRHGILTLDEELNSPGRGQLAFVQGIVRDVAYGTLARSDRRAMHLAAARYLEQLDDDVADELAGHLVAAHDLTADAREAGRLAHRALAALRRAATRARGLHASDRALGLLETALRLAGDDQRRSLLADAADAAAAAGRPDAAEAHLRELIAIQSAARDRSAVLHTRARLAGVLLTAQANEPALVELESAMRAIRRWEAEPSGVELAAQLARARSLLGDDAEGLAWAKRALPAAERLGLATVAADLLVTRGTARIALGDEEEGLADLSSVAERARAEGWPHVELRATNNHAWALLADDPNAALESARRGLDLATTLGLADIAASLADIACTAAIETGAWPWALATAEELAERQMPGAFRVVLAASATVVRLLSGDPDASRPLDDLGPLPPETDDQVVAAVRMAHAWRAFLGGRLEEARSLAGEAVAGSAGAEPPYHRALEARASLWLGDREAAERALAALTAPGRWGRAAAATELTVRAGVAGLARDRGAVAHYHAALAAWQALAMPLQRALCLLDAERLAPAAVEAADVSAAIDELGADGLRPLTTAVSMG